MCEGEALPRSGDNFELVYGPAGWCGDDEPGVVLAMILVGWLNERRCGDGEE